MHINTLLQQVYFIDLKIGFVESANKKFQIAGF